ncbi:hypothetical protein NDA01_30725 [Trichocoleus desertorum AS-A10]|uniref:hypothetical protein n=1 Tax=Trichocoleus desertorum TaxID=1481672 RepID=UPI00329A0CA0
MQALQRYLGVSELQLEGRSQLLIFEGLTVAIEVFVSRQKRNDRMRFSTVSAERSPQGQSPL